MTQPNRAKVAARFAACLLATLLLSCGDESPPGVDLRGDGGGPDSGKNVDDSGEPDLCDVRPTEGCACPEDGLQINCRPDLEQCLLGLRTCEGGVWSACAEVDYDNNPKGIGSNEQGLQERIGTLNDGDGTDPYDACELCQPECVVERDYDFADPSTTLDVCVEHRTPKPRSLDPLAPRSPNSGCYQDIANIVVDPDAGTDGALVIDGANTQGSFARIYEGCHLGAWPKTDWHDLEWNGSTTDDGYVTLEIRTGETITAALADTPITIGGSPMTPLGGTINIGEELVANGKINGYRYLHLTFTLNLSTTGISPEVYGFQQKFYCQDENGNLDPGLCSNGELDQGETNADCGGICGPTCVNGDVCVSDLDCDSAVCTGGACTGSSCTDNVLNGGESDIDCGAVCAASSRLCYGGEDCFTDADCETPYSCLTGLCTYDVCLAQTQIPVNECQELVDLYNATGGGTTWTNDWPEVLAAPAPGVAPTPCSWFGITCAGGNVSGIDVRNNNLTGSLPGSWLGSGMPALQDLRLANNAITGPFPASVGTVTSLTALWIGNGNNWGPLPDLSALTSLQALVAGDCGIGGAGSSLPSWLGNLTALRLLDMRTNMLEGTIPPSIGNLPNLQQLWLRENQITGQIPSTFANLGDTISVFHLDYNLLWGVVPFTDAQFVNFSSPVDNTKRNLFNIHNNACLSASTAVEGVWLDNLDPAPNAWDGGCIWQCSNSAIDGDETDLDCGGSCSTSISVYCSPGEMCSVANDCDPTLSPGGCLGNVCVECQTNADCNGHPSGAVCQSNLCVPLTFTIDPYMPDPDVAGYTHVLTGTTNAPISVLPTVTATVGSTPLTCSNVTRPTATTWRCELTTDPTQTLFTVFVNGTIAYNGYAASASETFALTDCFSDSDCASLGVAAGPVCDLNTCGPFYATAAFPAGPVIPGETFTVTVSSNANGPGSVSVTPRFDGVVCGTTVVGPAGTLTVACTVPGTQPYGLHFTDVVVTYEGETVAIGGALDVVQCTTATHCDDGLACTTDSCNMNFCNSLVDANNCVIGGACWNAGDTDTVTPNPYAYCDPAFNQYNWSAASCFDGYANGVETDIDCGGADCANCPNGSSCLDAFDCTGGVCNGLNACEQLTASPVLPGPGWKLVPGETFTISGTTNAADGSLVETLIYSPFYDCGTVAVSGGAYTTTCTVPVGYPLGFNYIDRYVNSGGLRWLHYYSGEIVECKADANCGGATPTCDLTVGSPTENTCVECTSDAQCGGGTPLCDSTGVCVECVDSSQCDDGNACTADVCNAGTCIYDAGLVCNISGTCYESGENRPNGTAPFLHEFYSHCDPSVDTANWSTDKTVCTSPGVDVVTTNDYEEFIEGAIGLGSADICDGFELGAYDPAMWDYGYNVSVTPGSYRQSDGQLTATAPTNSYAYLYKYDYTARPERYVHTRFYVQYPTATQSPESGTHYNIYETWGSTVSGLAIADNDELLVGYPYGGYQLSGVKLPHGDNWTCVQMDFDLATATVRLSLDGSPIISTPAHTYLNEHDIGILPWSTGYSTNAAVMHFDEFVTSRDDSARPIPCDP